MLTLCLLGVAALADPAPLEPAKAELKKLEGVWIVESHEHGGKKTPAKKLITWNLTVKGDRFTTREGLELLDESEVKLNPKARTIDLKLTAGPDKGQTVLGIYKLEGGVLTVCVAEPGKPRPGAFAAKEGTGATLFVFKRAKK
jgi:uncharacterized protein (TIGR03067 family)